MGTYNNTRVHMDCPRCGKHVLCSVDLHFGYTSGMASVSIGDAYPFLDERAPDCGGVLQDDAFGLGYTECPECEKDFHCAARIESGKLTEITPSMHEPPHCFDEVLEGSIPCPKCNSINTELKTYFGYSIGRLICAEKWCATHKLVELDHDNNLIKMPYESPEKLWRNVRI